MSKHSYPLSQGPFLLPIDCLASEKYDQLPIPQTIFLPRQLSVMLKNRAALTGLPFLEEFLPGARGFLVTSYEFPHFLYKERQAPRTWQFYTLVSCPSV